MKRIQALFAAIAIIIACASFSATAQFRYSPVLGVNINNLNFKQDLVTVGQTVGATAGIQGELMFPGIGFGIDFGLLYNQSGAKVNLGERLIWSSDGYGNENVMMHNIQIPLHLRFKWTRMDGLEDYIAPFVYGGPEFVIHAGHNKIKGNEGATKPFDYAGGSLGLTAGLGFEVFRNWQISGQYTWGMTYVLKTRLLDNFSARSSQWSVRVAYFF